MQKIKRKMVITLFVGILFFGNHVIYAAEVNQAQTAEQAPPEAIPQPEQMQQEAPLPEQVPEAVPQMQAPEEADPAVDEEAEKFNNEEGFEVLSTMMTANDEANVRSGPDTKYKSLGKLEVGQKVFVLGRLSGNWYQISFGDGNAFVACDYLTAPEVDDALIEEMQENMADNLAQVSEADLQIEQLQSELVAAKETAAQAEKAAESAKAELAAERAAKKQESPISLEFIVACMFAMVFIFGLVLTVKPDLLSGLLNKDKTLDKSSAEAEDDGLELISLTDVESTSEAKVEEPSENAEHGSGSTFPE